MKQAIFQAFKLRYLGKMTDEQYQALSNISGIAKKTSTLGEGIEELGEYAFLCQLEIALPTLSAMICYADRAGIPYRVTYLENDLEWINFNPEKLLSSD